jgi:hypothetical protein
MFCERTELVTTVGATLIGYLVVEKLWDYFLDEDKCSGCQQRLTCRPCVWFYLFASVVCARLFKNTNGLKPVSGLVHFDKKLFEHVDRKLFELFDKKRFEFEPAIVKICASKKP